MAKDDRPGPRMSRGALVIAASLYASTALACGQSTHIWIGLEAVSFLPDGDPLRTLLERDDLRASLIHGAMFPDGGYSPLTQDGYGETAHWEPFQTAYLHWIEDRFDPPYDGDGAPHVAFLMGMAAHGVADQIYDGVYLTRSELHDAGAWAQSSADYATDVVLTSRKGPQPLVDDAVPYDTLVEVFEAFGQPTSASTMALGQTSLRAAVQYIGNLGQQPDEAARYAAEFPWAAEHLTDPATGGSPASMQPAVAAYWLTLWDRLNGRFDVDARPVFATWPAEGARLPSTDAASADATVSVALSRGVDLATVTDDRIVVHDEDGASIPIGFRMYYGDHSNVLNVWSLDGWPDDQVFTLELLPGITSFDGVAVSRPWSTTFTTRDLDAAEGCGGGCRTGGGSAWLLAPTIALLRRRRPAATSRPPRRGAGA